MGGKITFDIIEKVQQLKYMESQITFNIIEKDQKLNTWVVE